MNRSISRPGPLIVYFTFACLTSWTIWFPLYSSAFGIKGLPVLPFHHGIGGLGPLMAAFLTTHLFEGRKGTRRLLAQLFKVRSLAYILVALVSPFLLVAAASAINYLMHQHPIELSGLFSSKEFAGLNFAQFLLYNLFFFGLGEETGWRGYALPRLQARYNALRASMLLTLLWALWHWPLFLYRPGFHDMGIAGTSGWLLSLLTGSVLLTWLYNGSGGSIPACAIFHATVDIAFLADFNDRNITNYMGILITAWGIVTILLFKPKNLSKKRIVITSQEQHSGS